MTVRSRNSWPTWSMGLVALWGLFAVNVATADEPTPPTIPPGVEARLEIARRAIAEAIVAAQDAGLVNSSIEPPPILDIIVQGYADDAKIIRNKDGKKPYAVSPEVFAGWFTNYGKLDGVNYVNDVRTLNPNRGLKTLFAKRADILNRHIAAVRGGKAVDPPILDSDHVQPSRATSDSTLWLLLAIVLVTLVVTWVVLAWVAFKFVRRTDNWPRSDFD